MMTITEAHMLVLGFIEILWLLVIYIDFGCVVFDPYFESFTGLFN